MSRSFKKYAGCKDGSKYAKQLHNRKYRKYERDVLRAEVNTGDWMEIYDTEDYPWEAYIPLPQYSSGKNTLHKKLGLNQYDVCDWSWFWYNETEFALTLEKDFDERNPYWGRWYCRDFSHITDKKVFVRAVNKRLKSK